MSDEFLRYIRPDEWRSADFTASSSNVDTSYQASWLNDRQMGYPLRSGNNNFSATLAGSSATLDAIVIAHHNLAAGTVVDVGGDVGLFMTAPAVPLDGIPLSFFGLVGSPSSADSITFSITGHAVPPVIGEIIFGPLRTVRMPLLSSHKQSLGHKNIQPAVDVSSVNAYDKGIATRSWGGTYLVNETVLNELIAWWHSQRGLSRPSVIIPDVDINDAWVVFFTTFDYAPFIPHQSSLSDRHWSVDLLFEELPRSRW